MKRDERRIQRAIDELIKIADDGHATAELCHTLDRLRELEIHYYFAEEPEQGNH
jgi:hypothetical protein